MLQEQPEAAIMLTALIIPDSHVSMSLSILHEIRPPVTDQGGRVIHPRVHRIHQEVD